LVQAYQKKESLESLNLLSEIEDLLRRTKAILDTAEAEKKYGIALKAIAEARGSYELLSKIAFALHQSRCTELELQRMLSGAREHEREQEQTELLKVLSDSELEMLAKLQLKIHTQDPKMKIILDAPALTFDDLKWEPEPKKQVPVEAPVDDEPEQDPIPEPDPNAVKPTEQPVQIPSCGNRLKTRRQRRNLGRMLGT